MRRPLIIPDYVWWLVLVAITAFVIGGLFFFSPKDISKEQPLPKPSDHWEEIIPAVKSLVGALYQSDSDSVVALLSSHIPASEIASFRQWTSRSPLSSTKQLTLSPSASDLNGWTWVVLKGGNIEIELALTIESGKWVIIWFRLL